MRIGTIQVKQGQRTNLSKTKKYKIYWRIYSNIWLSISKKDDLLKNAFVNVKKRNKLFEKGLKKIAKMQNLSQNEFNQIAVMRDLSWDEVEQIAKKKRKIKNYEYMKEEDLIISLLKLKESIAELFNVNLWWN